MGGGVFWVDSGRSLIEDGFYGVNGHSETNMPPGLPALLGIMAAAWGYSPAIFLRAMAVFGALAFLASYELLRRQAPRIVAAAICLLLMTSSTHFTLVTRGLWPCYPYAFTTISALLVAAKLEAATALTPRIIWGALLTTLVVISLMFASAAIAFLGAIIMSIVAIFLRNRHLALARLRIYLPVLLSGIVVQGLWMHHGRVPASAGISAIEWPLPGFPQSYLSQLKVKKGNYPELGLATPRDVAIRILENARDEAEILSRTLMRILPVVRTVPTAGVNGSRAHLGWTSIFVAVPLFLVALGWCDSIRRTGGGVQEWYFAGYEFIYLLWPWNWEPRFFLAIAPLVCLYLWHGGEIFILLARNNPRIIAKAWLPVGTIFTVCAGLSMHGPSIGSQSPYVELQNELSFAVWLLSAVLSAWIVWRNTGWLRPASAVVPSGRRSVVAARMIKPRLLQALAAAIVLCLIFLGLTMQLKEARANLDPNSIVNRSADADAGAWIRSNTDPATIVMARQVPSVHHFSQRKVVWFPPSSNAYLLMKGIVEHKINLVVVVRESYYYLPPDDVCFAALLATYPNAFHLIYKTQEFEIFEVDAESLSRSENASARTADDSVPILAFQTKDDMPWFSP